MGSCCSPSKKENRFIKDGTDNIPKYIRENFDRVKEIYNNKDTNNDKSFDINLEYFFNLNNSFSYNKNIEVSGILKLCLLKLISNITKEEQLKNIKNEEFKKILIKLKSDSELINNHGEIKNADYLPIDIQTILKRNDGNNIIEFSKYINSLKNLEDIENLILCYDKEKQVLIKQSINSIIKYEQYNKFFEQEIIKALKNSIFDYSIVSLTILDNENFENYERKKKQCPNCQTKILFHGTQINPLSNIITSEFKYARKPFYGMGIYFSDLLDYTSFYSGGDNYYNRRNNFNLILPPDSTFTLLASEVYYDQTLFKHIRDSSYFVEELNDFPSYEEIQTKYPDKMVPKNGIHFITVTAEQGKYLENSIISKLERKKGKFIGNEYVITEKEQICPIYGIKLKRNEFFILWRDPNFESNNLYSNYLKNRVLYANEIAKMNIYIEKSTEDALKFIHKRRYNKMILITSIGLDLSGKKFIEIARKIIGSNIIVLVFSSNIQHLNWIQRTTNLLYTHDGEIYQQYIKNYNEKGLKELKTSIEQKYKVQFPEFTDDFLNYPYFINEGQYSELDCSQGSPYVREVFIIEHTSQLNLVMNEDGSFGLMKDKKESFVWNVIIDDKELTMFSNGYYLGIDISNRIISDKYMKRWNYESQGNYFIIKTQIANKFILSVNNNILYLTDRQNYSLFEFIDAN